MTGPIRDHVCERFTADSALPDCSGYGSSRAVGGSIPQHVDADLEQGEAGFVHMSDPCTEPAAYISAVKAWEIGPFCFCD